MLPEHDHTARLVGDASRGDRDALLSLLERYAPDVQRYVGQHARDLLGPDQSAADVAQSVCREVLEHLALDRLSYRGEPQFRQWLYNAARFKIQNRRRDGRGQRAAEALQFGTASDPASQEALFKSVCSPSQEAMVHEEYARFQKAFAQLSPQHQQVITLARLEGLSHKDIAARLDLTEVASRALLSRALARLARLGTGW